MPCRIALPAVALAADLGDLDAAVAFGNRAERRTRLDHQHVAGIEQVAALHPLVLEAGERARGDARSALEVLGGNAGKRRTDRMIARALPGIARDAEHRRLPRPGVADHDGEIASLGHPVERRALATR